MVSGRSGAAGVGACFACLNSRAGTIVLAFEGLQNLESIGNFYKDGLGGSGSGPRAVNGIVFRSDTLAIIAQHAGGSGNFSNNPWGAMVAFFLSGAGDIMNVARGFMTSLKAKKRILSEVSDSKSILSFSSDPFGFIVANPVGAPR
jgi:hypothetical protein